SPWLASIAGDAVCTSGKSGHGGEIRTDLGESHETVQNRRSVFFAPASRPSGLRHSHAILTDRGDPGQSCNFRYRRTNQRAQAVKCGEEVRPSVLANPGLASEITLANPSDL